MLSLRVVEHLDIIEHIVPGLLAGSIGAPPDPFALEQVEEAFGYGIIVAIPSSAHGVLKIMGAQEGGSVDTGELAALI